MLASEFIAYLSKTDENRKRAFFDDEIRTMADINNRRMASPLLKLFCYEKAMHDPSPDVEETKERMRAHGATEAFIAEMASYMQQFEFDYPYIMQEAIRDAIHEMDNRKPDSPDPLCSIEWWFELNCM